MVRLLVALALSASSAQPREVHLAPREANASIVLPTVDAREQRQATLRYQAAQTRNWAEPVADVQGALARLEQAQQLIGARPTWWSRFAFPSPLNGKQRAAFEQAATDIQFASSALEVGAGALESRLAALQLALGDSSAMGVLRARVDAQQEQLRKRLQETTLLADAVATTLADRAGGFSARFRHYLRQLVWRDPATRLAHLRRQLVEWGAVRQARILSAELTYVQGAMKPAALPTTHMTPAYMAADTASLVLEDTTQGREVELSAQITAKAQELGSAKAAYDFVKNQTRLDWYYGSLKGSTETLREARGNDADLSALLIALLRAQGTPARYVRGTIELPLPRLAELMGFLSAAEVDALYGLTQGAPPFVLDPGVRDKALTALSTAGIPFTPVTSGGQVSSVRFLHTWVEAYIPYADYRGVGNSREGRQWVPLDPAIPGTGKYAAKVPVLDAFGQPGMSASALMTAFLGQNAVASPFEFTRARVQDLLASSGSSATYSDLLRSVAQRSESLPFVPGTLPYQVVSVHEELAFLPEDYQHRIRFSASDGSGVLLSATLPLHQLVGHRTVFTYKPATDADAEVIAQAGGIYQAPAAAVALTAVLRVDGQEKGVATRSVGLGAEHTWTMELLLPGGSVRRVDNRIIAGNLVAIGLGGPTNGYVESGTANGLDLDGPAPRFLYGRAVAYANAWTQGEEELGQLLQVVPVRSSASVVLVENQLTVDQVLGVRRQVIWKGLEVDADHRSMMPLEMVAGRGRQLMQLSGYQGSFLEAKVLTDGTREQAVSAVSVLQQANAGGVPILSITPANVASQFPQLSSTAEVVRNVQDQVAQGREVLIPLADQTIQDWTGTGFVASAPNTGEGGYFLSGLVSGAQTVASPAAWLDQNLVQLLEQPDRPPSTTDQSRIARIIKGSGTVLLRGTVGKPLTVPISVYVTTIEGIPVAGAPVVFRRASGAKPTFLKEGIEQESYQTVTDASGRAKVSVVPDRLIANYFIAEPGDPYVQRVGFNEITAETNQAGDETRKLVLASPFVVLGDLDVPNRIELPCSFYDPNGDESKTCYRKYQTGISMGQQLWAMVTDQHGNPIANQNLTWTQETSGTFTYIVPLPPALPNGAFLDYTVTGGAPRLLDPLDASQHASIVLRTDSTGLALTEFIPARNPPVPGESVPGAYAYADLVVRTGSVMNKYRFITEEVGAAEVYRLRLSVLPSNSFDGIYQSQFLDPVAGQVFRSDTQSASGWALTSGANVQMLVQNYTDPQAPVVIDNKNLNTSSSGDLSAVFWPSYEVDNGEQRNIFSATVGSVAVEDQWFIQAGSRRPSVEVARILPGGLEQPLGEFGCATVSDSGVSLKITNPAQYPIYARLSQQPAVSGTYVVAPPSPDVFDLDPNDPARIRLMGAATSILRLDLAPGSSGGTVRVDLEVPKDGLASGHYQTLDYASRTIRVVPGGTGIVSESDKLRAKLILPVRNFESTATPTPPALWPPTSSEPPIPIPAGLEFSVRGIGLLSVTVGSELFSSARVQATEDGVVQAVTPVAGQGALLLTAQGTLLARIPPSGPMVNKVTIAFEPDQGDRAEQTIPFETVIQDAGVLPVGHTLVKDVSVVDGHLVKQSVDLAVPGRGGGLQFARTYTSRGFEASPLGTGWTHSYRSYVVEAPSSGNQQRFILYGGEGGGQVFNCSGTPQVCTPQRGYHGTFGVEGAQYVYRSKSGMTYRYGQTAAVTWPVQHRLESIVDPAGNELRLEYGGSEADGEVLRVRELAGHRYLRFWYERPPGAKRAQLAQVELRADTGGLDESKPNLFDGAACISYRYDARQMLVEAKRGDGACASATAVRTEGYHYLDSSDELLQKHLDSYTDPNGVITRYEWYANSDSLPGEGQYLLMGDKAERVKNVIEPSPGGTTRFTYSLEKSTVTVLGQPKIAFATRVKSARPEVAQETVYWMDPYGGTSRVERPLSAQQTAVSSTIWDATHERPTSEQDGRGRQTSYSYDSRGNLIERRIATPALPASGDGSATVAPTDGTGTSVSEAVEKWSYDQLFGGVTCHVDAAGRVTVTSYDSGSTGTGLPLETRRYANLVPLSSVTSAATCDVVAAQAGTSASDIVTRRSYCQVNGTCVTGAVKGDLVSSTDGEGNVTRVLGYDLYGNPTGTQVSAGAGSFITTTLSYDGRSRLRSQTDTMGHAASWSYDGLDRVSQESRTNTKGGSPAVVKSYTYWPGGQIHLESNGFGLSRETTLNGLGLPAQVSETGPGLPSVGLTTSFGYDAAGNKTEVTDRRGVKTQTDYDWSDRPVQVRVSVADSGTFAAQNGESTAVGQNGVVASYGYDAAGNKVFETDLHGHRTDYQLDSLYRAVGVQSPPVPGATLGAGSVRYTVTRRFDLAGNKTYEADGNGQATAWEYDFASRVTKTTDAGGRVEKRGYDRNGNLLSLSQEAPEGTVHLSRSTTYDGLNRPLTMSEQVASVSGTISYTQQQSKYDDVNHLVATSDRRGYVTTRRLDDLDRVFEEVVDDGSGLIARPSDGRSALQLKTQYQYDAAGNRRLTTDPLGRQTEEHHDALGRVTGRSLPMGVTEAFGYDGEGHVVSATDRRGITQTRRYDPVGRETSEELVESLSAGGASLTTLRRTYNDSPDGNGLTSVTEVDARNGATTHWLDGLHREVRTVDAVNNAITAAFDAVNRRGARDRKGYQTTYQYDGVNRLTGQTEHQQNGTAVAYSQSTVYDDATRRQTAKDRRQIETVSERDGLGRLERVTRGIQVTRTVYDGNGNAVQVTDPNSHVTFAVFDGAGRRISETRGSGSAVASTTTYQYDAVGNRSEMKSARVTGVAYDLRETFDDLNRSVRTEDALGNVTTRAFDGVGNKLCEKRPLGNAGGAGIAHGGADGLSVDTITSRVCTGNYLTRYSYDELSKLVSVTDALSGQYSFVYDQARNLVAKQDANGSLATYWYDALNRRRGEHQHLDVHARLTAANRGSVPLSEGMSDPLSNTGTFDWQHLYDENGNPQQTTDPKGQVESMVYGALDRLESRSWANQPLPRELPALDSVAYLYDGNGNPTQVTEQKETAAGAVTEVTGRTFDNLDRLETETRYDGKLTRFGYDAKGNRTSVTDPDQVATSYTFDALDRLETATTPDGTATYRYWPDSLLRRVELPNGIQESRCYDAASRLTTIVTGQGSGSDTCTTSLNTISRYDHSYDANGNRLSQGEQRSDPATQLLGLTEQTTYGYDALDRLVGTRYGSEKAVLYRLDAVGNRTGEREAPAGAVTDLTAFDAVPTGDLTHDISSTFNRADWLLSQTDSKDVTRSATYRYDWNGNLVSKTKTGLARQLRWDARNTLTAVIDNGTEVGRYDYDHELQRVKRKTASENVEYVLDDHFVLQEASATAGHLAYRRYHYAKQPLSVVDTGQGPRFLSNDALGSVSDLTTASGSLYAKRQYDAWGQYRGGTAPAANQPKLGYTGHQFDVETGLVYARARYYDPESGIFLSRDTVEGSLFNAPKLNRYAYAADNPLIYIDANGRWWTLNDWKNAGLSAGGYVWGVGKSVVGIGLIPVKAEYYMVGAALYTLSGNDPTYAHQKDVFNQGVEGIGQAVKHPGTAAWRGFTAGLAEMNEALDRNDAFGASEGLGEFVLTAASSAMAATNTAAKVSGALRAVAEGEEAAAAATEGAGAGQANARAPVKRVIENSAEGGAKRVPASQPGESAPVEAVPTEPIAEGNAPHGANAPPRAGPYAHVPDPASVGPGEPFRNRAHRRRIFEANRQANEGVLRSDKSGRELVPGKKHEAGVTPPDNEAQIDHIDPRSRRGPNSSANARVLARDENIEKSDTPPTPEDYERVRVQKEGNDAQE